MEYLQCILKAPGGHPETFSTVLCSLGSAQGISGTSCITRYSRHASSIAELCMLAALSWHMRFQSQVQNEERAQLKLDQEKELHQLLLRGPPLLLQLQQDRPDLRGLALLRQLQHLRRGDGPAPAAPTIVASPPPPARCSAAPAAATAAAAAIAAAARPFAHTPAAAWIIRPATGSGRGGEPVTHDREPVTHDSGRYTPEASHQKQGTPAGCDSADGGNQPEAGIDTESSPEREVRVCKRCCRKAIVTLFSQQRTDGSGLLGDLELPAALW